MTLLEPKDNPDEPKRALVLAGGGMRVAYQAGVLVALEEANLAFHHVDGTSGGTINTAMLFSDNSPQQMCERWSNLAIGDFVSFLPLTQYANPLKMKAMGDADGIVEKVFPQLGIEIARINQPRKAIATFNVCNHSTKQNIAYTNDQARMSHLIAGISLPIFMPAVKIDGDFYTDSVWIKDANLMEAVKRGAEEIILVWCIGNSHDFYDGAFLQYVHMIELSANGTLLEEFDRIRELNQRIANSDSPYGQRRPIQITLIKPNYPIPLDPDLYLGCINAKELIAIGYQNAKKRLLNAAPNEMDWHATQMQEPHAHLYYRLQIEAKTEQGHWLQLHLRCHLYELSAEKNLKSAPTEIFALLNWGETLDQLAACDGSIRWSDSEQTPTRITLSFIKVGRSYRLQLDFSKDHVDMVLIEVENEQVLDRLHCKIPRWSLFLSNKLQVKGSGNFFTAAQWKWNFISRLLGA